ncbi:hypothetical protein Naga_101459g1, partial [Nannochloropsis gaditana]
MPFQFVSLRVPSYAEAARRFLEGRREAQSPTLPLPAPRGSTMAMNFLRRAYAPSDSNVPEGDQGGDNLHMTEQDLIKAMKQLQHDDSVPEQTRELINQISQKFVRTAGSSDMHDIGE